MWWVGLLLLLSTFGHIPSSLANLDLQGSNSYIESAHNDNSLFQIFDNKDNDNANANANANDNENENPNANEYENEHEHGNNYYTYNDNDMIPTTSIIDMLSSNDSFTYLLKTLQSSDLINYINELNNITFLAPINEAFIKNKIELGSKLSKNQINRFIIDKPLLQNDIIGINIFNTLNSFGSPFIKNLNIPILVDNSNKDNYLIENSNVLNQSLIYNQDSVLLTIDDLLFNEKESICEYFLNSLNRNTGDQFFRIFSKLIINDNTCNLLKLSNITILLPSDNSLNLNDIEINYLLNMRGYNDKLKILFNYLFTGIYGGNLNNNSISIKNLNNYSTHLSSTYLGNELIIDNKTHSSSSNFLLSDGIIHYFDTNLFNHLYPIFTPRKYLIGLNYLDFIDVIDFKKISYLIDDNSINQSIFISNDYKSKNFINNSNLKNQLLYYFTNSTDLLLNLNPVKKLIDSKYCSSDKFCQKLKFQIDQNGNVLINSNSKLIINEPYKIGNTSIYLIDNDLSLPLKLQTAIGSELVGFEKSIKYFKKFNLFKFLSSSSSNENYTIFFPSSHLWKSLDLLLDYLIENDDILLEILQNLILKNLIYHDFNCNNCQFQNLNNNNITISTKKSQFNDDDDNNNINNDGNNNTLIFNNEKNKIHISFDDEILFNNGVLHPINYYDNLPLPKNLKISTIDLLKFQENLEFNNILKFLNISYNKIEEKNYSILLPSSKSLLQENITLLNDLNYLENFIKLHILPSNSIDLILQCNLNTSIPTLINNTFLNCRKLATGSLMLSLNEGNLQNEIRVLRSGLSIDENNNLTSGILLIDRPINPNWLNNNNNNNGKLYLHLPFIAMLVGILIGILFVILIFGCCMVLMLGNNKNDKNLQTSITNHDENITNLSDPRIEHIVTVNERLPLLNDNIDINKSNVDMNNDNNNNGDVRNISNKNIFTRNYGSSYNHEWENNDLKYTESLGRYSNKNEGRVNINSKNRQEYRKNNDNNSNNNNNNKLSNSLNVERSNMFDANYSMNASIKPIDMV